ncbi:MAG: ribosomal protein S12 methylthiotransferase accessory factor [Candidatus Electronema aureum]|uniref:Ribosomal protein S12 methylthiotransferase accessory factor n=1 Tax=Candidatus Electronema aureum TaxID=2005002 RepID=A0A521G0Q7_9BACT|nr:MAG: ribosomal protein S12 methylthiotransferase accessory factor [Candidatus Electronema aureum]
MQKSTLRLRNCPKRYTYDQDKACTPMQTVEHFQKRLKAAGLDILKEVRRIDTGRLDIPVFFSICGEDAIKIIGTKKQMGKGSTPEQSKASACMELGERFSFFSFIKNSDNFLIGDYAAMREAGHPVLPIKELLLSVHDTTRSSELLERLLAGLPLRWTWARNLSRDEDVLVPFSWFYAINEFNGPCAGNTIEEALLQGISEVVERHVCALIAREKLRVPAIDLNSVTDPVARALIDKFERNGIKLYVNDFSLDTGIPTIGALAWDPTTFPQKSELIYTAGTTPGPDKAIIRALTEVAQLAGDFETGSNYVASGLPKPLTLSEIDYIVNPGKTVSVGELPDLSADDMLQELHNCLTVLHKNQMEVLAVNTTHPQLQIPAAYVIIPGAHFRERAASGDAALFAAKLAAELLKPAALEEKLAAMRQDLPRAYYVEFYRGRNLYDQGLTEPALYCFETALTLEPHDEDKPYLYSYLGACLRDLGQFEEAVPVLEKGLNCDEERPDIHNMLGVCHYKASRFEQAVYHFQRAVQLNPVSAIDYANLALNLQRLGRNEEAITNYQVALEQDADIAFAAENLAKLRAED